MVVEENLDSIKILSCQAGVVSSRLPEYETRMPITPPSYSLWFDSLILNQNMARILLDPLPHSDTRINAFTNSVCIFGVVMKNRSEGIDFGLGSK